MSDTSRRVALVTGASQGIGKSIALRLAKDGLHVGINDIPSKLEALTEVARLVEEQGVKSAVFPGDVTKESDVKAMIDGTAEKLGGFDVMIANAGIMLPVPFLEESVENFSRTTEINMKGTFLCYQYAGRKMIQAGHQDGRIIGACSFGGKRPAAGLTSYVASKFAVRGLTQCAALELGPHGITVNAYAPGMIDTDMITKSGIDEAGGHTLDNWAKIVPMGRYGVPTDIANVVSFLASKDASWITGQAVRDLLTRRAVIHGNHFLRYPLMEERLWTRAIVTEYRYDEKV
ncbi:hypothetical protein HDZ31DRAFT_62495 [Schizophyllum fasciatum]